MKYKSIHTDKNGINWDTYTNQEDEVIWQDSIEQPGHRFNDRQVEHLIQITNYKNRCLNISDMEALDKLMENITSILLGLNEKLNDEYLEPKKINQFRETFFNLSKNDKTLIAKHLMCDRDWLEERLKSLIEYQGVGRPKSDYVNKVRELIFESVSIYVCEHDLNVPRNEYNRSGLSDFYIQSFSALNYTSNEILFSDQKKLNRFIENSLEKIN